MTLDTLKDFYATTLGAPAQRIYASPGRINLIGEHTDYNNGYVFPGAVQQGIFAAITPNGTQQVTAYSMDLNDHVTFDLTDPDGPQPTWARFIYGVCREMLALGVEVQGFDTAFFGNVPLGAGMSSSAALESCYAFALNDMFGGGRIEKYELARVGQRTEHKYIGCNCGIMDQFASVHGRAGSLMRLDCRSGQYEYFPWQPQGYRLLLVNSGVKHQLSGSPYNERRMQCETVAAVIARRHPEVQTLRDADMTMLDEVRDEVTPTEYKRARYVIGEVERVLTVCDALQRGDYETVGQQMYATHHGLSQEYEVSCEELDFLCDVARQCGVTGSRIMGGGFGGCTINLVRTDGYDAFCQAVTTQFQARYGHAPKLIDVVIGDGSRRIE